MGYHRKALLYPNGFSSSQRFYEQFLVHVQHGMRLMQQSRSSGKKSRIILSAERLLAVLRLSQDMQAPEYAPQPHLLQFHFVDRENEKPHSQSLESLAVEMLNLNNGVSIFVRRCNSGQYIGQTVSRENEPERLQGLSTILRNTMAECNYSRAEALPVKILQAQLELSWIILQCCHTLYQTSFDTHTENFETILDLVEAVLPADEQAMHSSSFFSVDLGFIPLLSYTSCLCRQPELRLRAVKLLGRCPRIEGMWNAQEAIAVANFIINFEEQPMQNTLPACVP